MLSHRQLELIQYLVQQNHPVTGKDLAVRFSVSDRTVRSDINAINDAFARFHYQIRADRNGYFISSPDRSWFREQTMLENDNVPDSSSVRIGRVLFTLLWLEAPASTDEISECIYLSRSSTVKILQQIKEYLADDGNTSLRYVHQGVMIEGRESARRDLIGRFLFDCYVHGEIGSIKALLIEMKLIRKADFLWLYDCLIQCLNEQHMTLSDRGMYLFTMELLLVIQRIAAGFYIEEDYEKTLPDLPLPYESFEKHFDISLSGAECAYISSRMAERHQIRQSCGNVDKVRKTINTFIDELKNTWGIQTEAFAPYRKGLEEHLSSMIDRLHHHVAMDHTMVDEMRMQYPYAFECATAILPILKKNLGISVTEAEISYIAVYLAVILNSAEKKLQAIVLCASGVGTGILLRRRLDNYFGSQLDLHGPYPVYQLPMLLKKMPDADLIISTVPVSENAGIPVLQVSPVFSLEEQNHLRRYIQTHTRTIQADDCLFLQPDLFYQFDDSVSREQMLKVMAAGLEKKGMVEDAQSFVTSIMEREELYSTVYGRIWIPHPINAIAIQNGAAVAVVHHQDIALVFMLAVPRENTEAFSAFYNKILLLLDKTEWIDRLQEVDSFSSFLKVYAAIQ